jgi:hypothetical protein
MVWQVRYYNDHRIQIRIVVWQTFNIGLTIKMEGILVVENDMVWQLLYNECWVPRR